MHIEYLCFHANRNEAFEKYKIEQNKYYIQIKKRLRFQAFFIER